MTEALLGTRAIGSMMGLSARTIQAWASDDKIPHYRFDGIYLFKRSEIEAWIEEKHRGVATGKKK